MNELLKDILFLNYSAGISVSIFENSEKSALYNLHKFYCTLKNFY